MRMQCDALPFPPGQLVGFINGKRECYIKKEERDGIVHLGGIQNEYFVGSRQERLCDHVTYV